MAHGAETKAAVRAAYVHDRLSLEGVAGKTGVPVATIRRWKAAADAAGDDWDKARHAHSLSAAGAGGVAQLILADYLTLHQKTMDALMAAEGADPLKLAEAMSRLADAFTKTMAAVAKAAPDLARFAVATELLGDLAQFAAERHPQHALALAELLEPFAAYVSEKYQ